MLTVIFNQRKINYRPVYGTEAILFKTTKPNPMKYFICCIALFFAIESNAQTVEPIPLLTLEEAIAIGLQNNYDIIISKNDVRIASNNNSIIMAGFLPTASLNATQNNSINNTRQEFFNGTIQEGNNAG